MLNVREIHVLHTQTHAQVIMHLLLVSSGKCVHFPYLMLLLLSKPHYSLFVFPFHNSNHYVERHAIASHLSDCVA